MTLNIDNSQKRVICIGFSPWKRRTLRYFLKGRQVVFKKKYSDSLSPMKDFLILWASTKTIPLEEDIVQKGFQYLFCEDGFIRSSGLGIKLFLPGSLSFSGKGIHFDATRTTELETLLNTQIVTSDQLQRSSKVIEYIKRNNISKYGRSDSKYFPSHLNNKKNILVIGQVENDASLEYGSPNIKRNSDLIREVISMRPDSNIYYKPHPDVVSKLRIGEVDSKLLQESNVTELRDISLSIALKNCDEVHVLSSQSGLDALILNKEVFCHGLPFYSGWGLTNDLVKTSRRKRTISLEELVYISFIKYPTYLNPKTKEICEVEEILELISNKDFKWPHAPNWMQILIKIKREYLKYKNGKAKV